MYNNQIIDFDKYKPLIKIDKTYSGEIELNQTAKFFKKT